MEIITNLRGNIIVIIDFQLKTNSELEVCDVNPCYGVTKDPNENDYLLVFLYAKNGVIYQKIYQKILKKLLGKVKFCHFVIFHQGKFVYTY